MFCDRVIWSWSGRDTNGSQQRDSMCDCDWWRVWWRHQCPWQTSLNHSQGSNKGERWKKKTPARLYSLGLGRIQVVWDKGKPVRSFWCCVKMILLHERGLYIFSHNVGKLLASTLRDWTTSWILGYCLDYHQISRTDAKIISWNSVEKERRRKTLGMQEMTLGIISTRCRLFESTDTKYFSNFKGLEWQKTLNGIHKRRWKIGKPFPSGPGSGENCGSLSTMEIESCDERNPTMSDFKPF